MQTQQAAADVTNSGSYSDPLSDAVDARDKAVVANIRRALDREDAFLLFQPVVEGRRTGKIAFYEGLIRILDDTGRVIPANDFISAVEDKIEGRMIDCLAIKLGIETLIQRPDIRLSINMSARSIGYKPWLDAFETALEVDPSVADRLILEITESSAMAAPEVTSDFMERLQARGVSFALDDFGAGYTSFRYLKDFFFDIVKFDRDFIKGIDRDPDNRACIAALHSVARHFDMFTVAEGVETIEEATVLAELGVDCLQGYLYGAPAFLGEAGPKRRRA